MTRSQQAQVADLQPAGTGCRGAPQTPQDPPQPAEAGLSVQPHTEGLITGGSRLRAGQSAVSADSFTID